MSHQKKVYLVDPKIRGVVIINPIFEQSIYYGVVMILSILAVSVIQKGFFLKYIKVRVSFGRLILIKLRAVNRDFFATGKIDEGFIVFKTQAGTKRISVTGKDCFYRSLAVTWIDIDDEKNAICKPDYSVISGFDAIKYQNLYTRTLYKPGIKDNTTRLIIGGLLLIAVGIGIVAFLVYKQNYTIESLVQQVSSVKGVIAGGNV